VIAKHLSYLVLSKNSIINLGSPMYTIAPFIILACLFTILFHIGRKSFQHKAAYFALHSVSDDLVCLVANGKIQKDGVIFQYYYEHANRLLSAEPKVGLNCIVGAFIAMWGNHNVKKEMEATKKKIVEFQNLPEMQSE